MPSFQKKTERNSISLAGRKEKEYVCVGGGLGGWGLSSVGEMFPQVLDKAGNSVPRVSDSRQVSLIVDRGWVGQLRLQYG